MSDTPSITLELPVDIEAERRLVGICLTSRHGADLAGRRVNVDDFYDARLGRLFVAATACTKRRTIDRVLDVAKVAGEYVSFVKDLEELDRLSLHDESGAYSRRVVVAAQRRRSFLNVVGEYVQ